MFGSSVVEVALGLVFVYLFLSLVCTAVNEAIAQFFNQRGKNLLEAVKNLLNDHGFSDLARDVYDHGLVGAISRNAANPDKANGLPSYMSAHVFATSLVDALAARHPQVRDAEDAMSAGRQLLAAHPDPLGELQGIVKQLPGGHTRDSLFALLDKTRRQSVIAGTAAQEQIQNFQNNIETWFNEAMDRAGGWYKRWTQKVLFAVAATLVIAGNADTLMMAKRFFRDGSLRAAVIQAAEKSVANAQQAGAQKHLLDQANSLDLPLGWNAADKSSLNAVPALDDPLGIAGKIFGLFLTIGAVSLGAPFWFDTLGKIVNLRSSGAPPVPDKAKAP